MKALLIVKEGPNRGEVFEIVKGDTTLGRGPTSTIQIVDDKTSRQHAVIAFAEKETTLRDLDSKNGTYVNGVLCSEKKLFHGDEIQVGDTRFIFLFSEDDSFEGQIPMSSETQTILETSDSVVNMIGDAPQMKEVYQQILKVSPTSTTVLITGESGTGKELVSRAVHLNSPRRNSPFIAVNCAYLPETLLESELFGHEKGAFTGAIGRRLGRFELADRGTLFLDEIGELSPATQAKLLRVVEQGEFERVGGTETLKVDIRILAATNIDISKAVKELKFREDLYYRLRVVEIHLPPLRERNTDIPLLVDCFLSQMRKKFGHRIKKISDGVLERLETYHWPGNIRELRNVMESMVLMAPGEQLEVDDLPLEIQMADGRAAGKEMPGLREVERRHIIKALKMTKGNKSKAAELLGIDRRTLYSKIDLHKIKV